MLNFGFENIDSNIWISLRVICLYFNRYLSIYALSFFKNTLLKSQVCQVPNIHFLTISVFSEVFGLQAVCCGRDERNQ
jgi:hypothetical protein